MLKNVGLAFTDVTGPLSIPDSPTKDKNKRPTRTKETKIICAIFENLGPIRLIKTRMPSKPKRKSQIGKPVKKRLI